MMVAIPPAAGRVQRDDGHGSRHRQRLPLGASSVTSVVWVVGDGGHAAHWDGERWSPTKAGQARLNAVWGSAPDHFWTGGADGIAYRWRGHGWEGTGKVRRIAIGSIWGTSAGEVWIPQGRTLVSWSGTAWASTDGPSIRAIWGSGARDLWAIGERVILRRQR